MLCACSATFVPCPGGGDSAPHLDIYIESKICSVVSVCCIVVPPVSEQEGVTCWTIRPVNSGVTVDHYTDVGTREGFGFREPKKLRNYDDHPWVPPACTKRSKGSPKRRGSEQRHVDATFLSASPVLGHRKHRDEQRSRPAPDSYRWRPAFPYFNWQALMARQIFSSVYFCPRWNLKKDRNNMLLQFVITTDLAHPSLTSLMYLSVSNYVQHDHGQ